jgi:5-methylcytosine-specific restriction endonuclease McrA
MARKRKEVKNDKAKPKLPKLKMVVCKPCWELRYCPYGPLVENFPLCPERQDLAGVEKRYRELLDGLANGKYKTEAEILTATEYLERNYLPRWQWISQYDTKDLACTVFGHTCPVFFVAEPFTETKEGRRRGRIIPREIMLKVVRRDGQICQICNKPVRDDEVEFDHFIPHSKGGPLTADNIRLVCRKCNRKKSNSLKEILYEPPKVDLPAQQNPGD